MVLRKSGLRVEGETRERENSELDQFHSMVIMSAVLLWGRKGRERGKCLRESDAKIFRNRAYDGAV